MNMNEALQQSLYDKLSREQDKYRDWLKGQPPEEILHHSYEYTVREDILMSMEELTLSEAETRALLLSPSPMAILYDKFSDLETGYMDTIRDSIEDTAKDEAKKLRDLPVYGFLCSLLASPAASSASPPPFSAFSACSYSLWIPSATAWGCW